MPKLPGKTNGFLPLFFTKPHLVEFLLIMIVSFLIPTRSVYPTCFYSGFSKFVPVSKIFNFYIFKCNSYPVNIIDQCIKKFLEKLYVPKQIVPTVPKREFLVLLSCLGTFSLNLRKLSYKLSVSRSLLQCSIKVIFQSKNWLSSFFKFKASIPLYLCSNDIYKFQCSNCNITYYGETGRHLKVTTGEHIIESPLMGKKGNNNKKSSIKDHCLLSGHIYTFDNFTVLN